VAQAGQGRAEDFKNIRRLWGDEKTQGMQQTLDFDLCLSVSSSFSAEKSSYGIAYDILISYNSGVSATLHKD
jgi:hypothetical protein